LPIRPPLPQPSANRLGKTVLDLGPNDSLLECLHDVGDEIYFVLDTTADPDKVVEHTGRLTLLLGDTAVRHGTGYLDQRLDTAQRLRKREDLSCLAETLRRLVPALNAERQHAAPHAVAVLLLRNRALRM